MLQAALPNWLLLDLPGLLDTGSAVLQQNAVHRVLPAR